MAAIIKTDQLWLDQTTSSTVGAPALIFGADSLSGLYRIGTNNIGLAINGTKLLDLSSGAVAITGTLAITGATTLSSTLAAGNTTITGTLSATSNATFATTNTSGKVGIGTASPAVPLEVSFDGGIQSPVAQFTRGTKKNQIGTDGNGGFIGTTTNDPLLVYTNNAVAATFNVSGSLGIGVATVSSWPTNWKAIEVGYKGNSIFGYAGNYGSMGIMSNVYFDGADWRYANTGAAAYQYLSGGNQYFYASSSGTAGAALPANDLNYPALSISSSGNYNCIGMGVGNPSYSLTVAAKAGSPGPAYIYQQSTGTGVYIPMGNNTWSSASDERLKDIIEPITDAANKLSSLRTVMGKYKTDEDGTRRPFIIAQDVQKIMPEVIDDAPNEHESGETMMGVQYANMIPLMIAAINELTAKVAVLEAK